MSYSSQRGKSKQNEGSAHRTVGGTGGNGNRSLPTAPASLKVDLGCGNLRRNQMEHSLGKFVKRDGSYDFPKDINLQTKMNCQGYIDLEMISEPASPGNSVLRMFVREKPGLSTHMQFCGKFPTGDIVVIAEGLKQ